MSSGPIPPRILRLFSSFSASSESDSRRDGFASWKGETHPIAYGFALGFLFAAPLPRLQALAVAAIVCTECARWKLNRRVLAEVRDEPQYFLPSIVVGVITAYFLHGLYIFST